MQKNKTRLQQSADNINLSLNPTEPNPKQCPHLHSKLSKKDGVLFECALCGEPLF